MLVWGVLKLGISIFGVQCDETSTGGLPPARVLGCRCFNSEVEGFPKRLSSK